jgi:hypothetical protein
MTTGQRKGVAIRFTPFGRMPKTSPCWPIT